MYKRLHIFNNKKRIEVKVVAVVDFFLKFHYTTTRPKAFALTYRVIFDHFSDHYHFYLVVQYFALFIYMFKRMTLQDLNRKKLINRTRTIKT